MHENTKIWSRPTLVQQSAIEGEDAIERMRKKETVIVKEEAHKQKCRSSTLNSFWLQQFTLLDVKSTLYVDQK